MVAVQMLAELEEVIQYKILPERRAPIRKMWWQRLQVYFYSLKLFEKVKLILFVYRAVKGLLKTGRRSFKSTL